jgi:hypothetical protein
MIQVGQRYGMQTMEDSMRALVDKGIVDPSEVASMNAKLNDSGPAAGGEAVPRPAAAAPAAPQPAAAGGEPRKSRSLF